MTRTPPPYPYAGAPGVHIILTPSAGGYFDIIVWAGVSQHKAAEAWAATGARSGNVFAQVWHDDHVQRATWSALWDHLHTTTTEAP
jgi:hypothetical protein